jgi:hypothetical protein
VALAGIISVSDAFALSQQDCIDNADNLLGTATPSTSFAISGIAFDDYLLCMENIGTPLSPDDSAYGFTLSQANKIQETHDDCLFYAVTKNTNNEVKMNELQKCRMQYIEIARETIKDNRNKSIISSKQEFFPKSDSSPYKSPLKQIKENISPQNIHCNYGFELIFKATTNSPACVTPHTKQKLISVGWTKPASESPHNDVLYDKCATLLKLPVKHQPKTKIDNVVSDKSGLIYFTTTRHLFSINENRDVSQIKWIDVNDRYLKHGLAIGNDGLMLETTDLFINIFDKNGQPKSKIIIPREDRSICDEIPVIYFPYSVEFIDSSTFVTISAKIIDKAPFDGYEFLGTSSISIVDVNGTEIKKIDFVSGDVAPTVTDYQYSLDVVIDNSDRIIVADSSNNRIQIFDKNGYFLTTFGSLGSTNGKFNFPSSITTDNSDRIIVADSSNNRIQIFDKNGEFVDSILLEDILGHN